MAAFGIGTNSNIKNITVDEVQGKQVEVACDCWFSRKGKTIPQYLKYEDEDGEIRTIHSIRVITSEDKTYCGIKTREFICSTEMKDQEYEFKLIFRKEECRWFMVV